MLRLWLASIVFVVIACAVPPRPPPAPLRQTSLGLDFAQFELANGLHVVVVKDPQATDVHVTMRYRVGSIDDPPDHPGMAHLVEHLMYQQVLGAQSVFAHLENASPDFNGSTSLDATTYVARAPLAKLEELLSIEAVRVGLRCATITDSVFAREREVVVNEVRMRGRGRELMRALYRALYPAGHPYRDEPGDSPESVAAITLAQACAFADAHYAPSNAALVVSGPVTGEQVAASIGKFLGRIPRRAAEAQRAVPAVATTGRALHAPVPIDEDSLLVAWPLPANPEARLRIEAVAPMVAALVDDAVTGHAAHVVLGGEAAPVLAIFVEPGKDETLAQLREGVRHAMAKVPELFVESRIRWLDAFAFQTVQQRAIYRLFGGLADGRDRDTQLATYMLAGSDPQVALGRVFESLRSLTRVQARSLVAEFFDVDKAIVVELAASERARTGAAVTFDTGVHDLGQRRDPPDPAEARVPLQTSPVPAPAARTRTLANGLRVVLLPTTTVPTIDIRLVFAAGVGDEPANKLGVAPFAAHGLEYDMRYINDLMPFIASGGSRLLDVGLDATTFEARGLDMHLDLLLAGLRRWVREGTYDDVTDNQVTKKQRDVDALDDARRAALFGEHHPYAAAGAIAVSVADLAAFRAAHYTPDNATLVIAGRFDPALADRWIDYLFADWTGRAAPRASPAPSPHPASLAKIDATTQLYVQIALPALAGDRARRLVASAMLDDLARDVRHQLGASYDLQAALVEERLAAHHTIAGWIDAPRAAPAIQLVRDRLAALRTPSDATQRAFVTARARVHARLTASTASSDALAARITADLAAARAPGSDAATAVAVAALTIDAMADALAELDPARAIIVMRGPETAIHAGFGALGRTPTFVHAEANATRTAAIVSSPASRTRETADGFDDALTLQRPPPTVALTVAPHYISARQDGHDVTGLGLTADLGYRADGVTGVGVHLAIGSLSGSYQGLDPGMHEIRSIPIAITPFVQATLWNRLWGAATVGLHLEHIRDGDGAWNVGFALGAEGGVDIARIGGHRLGLYGGFVGGLGTGPSYTGSMFGIDYRR